MYLIFLLVGLILSIVSIIIMHKKPVFWNIFLGIIIARFITAYPLYVLLAEDDDLGLGGALVMMFVMVVSFINTVIMFIVGMISKSKLKKERPDYAVKTNFVLPIVIVVYIIIGILLLVVLPKYRYLSKIKPVEEHVLNYYKTTFGDESVNIKSIEKDYSYNGIVQKYHTGYTVTMTSYYIDDEFSNDTDLDGNMEFSSSCHSMYLCKYYYSKYGYVYGDYYYHIPGDPVEIDLELLQSKIPKDLGHVPTFDEMYDFEAIERIDLNVSGLDLSEYKKDISSRITLIGTEVTRIYKKFDINKDVKCKFHGSGAFIYDVDREGSNLKIYGYNKNNDGESIYEEYIFDMNTSSITSSNNNLN